MATCQITEFAGTPSGNSGITPVAKHVNTVQNVTYTTAADSSAIGAKTSLVRIIADADVYLDFDGNTATANSLRLPSDTVEYFAVVPGQVISCYDGSS